RHTTMPLISFEGVEVDIPAKLQGIQFSFSGGALTIQCRNFTGDVVLSKPDSPSMGNEMSMNLLSSFSNTVQSLPEVSSIEMSNATVKEETQTASRKRAESPNASSKGDSADEVEAVPKRLRPNFLNDVEQTMLLAQLEASQVSQQEKLDAVDNLVGEFDKADDDDSEPVPEPMAVDVPAATEPSTPSPIRTQVSPASSAVKGKKGGLKKKLFSPEPTKKNSPPSTGKKGRGKKAAESTQLSIRDMMMTANLPGLCVAFDGGSLPIANVSADMATGRELKWELVEVKGNTPAERWGHTLTKIGKDKMVLYGGANDDEETLGDLFVFNMTKREWSRPINCESILRTWHDAVFLESKNLLLVFGGERVVGEGQTDALSDIMVLDTTCFLWYPPAVSGVGPMARSGHTCTAVGDDVVVFGGSRGRSRQSTVHVLDSNTWHWRSIKVEGKPPTARTYHSAVAVGESVVVFGGNDNKKCFSSVHVLKKKDEDGSVWSWFHPCVVGKAPTARTGHSATLVSASKILIYGGWDPQQEGDGTSNVFGDAFVLDTESWEWEPATIQPSDDGVALTPRVGHRAVADADGSVFLFGGQDAHEKRLNGIHALHFQATTEPSKA
ncbi:TPA: hypothetical protein N0F65_012794, partial [Lagenidium giganteum]